MKFLNRERLNLVIALSAIMISLASFYATYLQAKAADIQAKVANQQLKIMTMPVVRFSHTNYDREEKNDSVTFFLQNAGSGPGILKSIEYHYRSKNYTNHTDLLQACCKEEFRITQKKIARAESNSSYSFSRNGVIWSGDPGEFIIPAQDKYTLFSVSRGDTTTELWKKINEERWNVTVSACFCSPLGNCYQSNSKKMSDEVDYCPTD